VGDRGSLSVYESAFVRFAPRITESQSKLLRLARDGGTVQRENANPSTFAACCGNRWLAKREKGYVLTDGGRAALMYYDADAEMERLWDWKRVGVGRVR